ncbi:porin [Shewanella insulae]|uniref:porin n=1 Tax=Shewanella insulae TaxID=2681496 RepID=UPI001EFE1C8C|nr:porin [Shewanella insulae]MCG9714732.1 porin [Shewanella insulae]
MKISNIALVCAATFTFAQNAFAYDEIAIGDFSITPYARIVAGVSYTNNLVDAGLQGSRWEAAANQWGTSYIGLSFGANLTEGWKGVVNLESGFGTNNGAMNVPDTFFDRAANAGLSHENYGTLTIGTHLSLAQDISAMDPLSFQIYGLNSLTNGVNDGSATESVLYRSAEFAGVSVALMHEFGGIVGDAERSTGDGVALSFTHGGFDFKTIYQQRADEYGRYSGGEFYGLGTNSQWINVKNWVSGISYDFGAMKVFAGYDNIKAPEAGYASTLNTDTKANVYWGGLNYQATDNVELLAGYYHSKLDESGKSSSQYTMGVNYDWTKYVTLYGTIGYITNSEVSDIVASGAGINNHGLTYTDAACENLSDCDGASQFGSYVGVVVNM